MDGWPDMNLWKKRLRDAAPKPDEYESVFSIGDLIGTVVVTVILLIALIGFEVVPVPFSFIG